MSSDESRDDGPLPLPVSRNVQIVLVVAFAVVLPGIVDGYLSQAGFGVLGAAVWVVSYLGGALVVWYYVLRPMELVGESDHSPPPEK